MDRPRWRPVVHTFLPLLLAVVCSALLFHLQYRYDNKYTGYRPTSRDGVMWLNNTSSWSSDGLLLHLVDGWEIYQDKLLDPAEIPGSVPDAYLFLGQYGGLNLWDRTRLPYGDATYRTTILTDGVPRAYALELPEIYSAYRIWINEEPMGGKGRVGDAYSPGIGGAFLTFPAKERVEIVVQVSDHDGYYSGMVYPPAFGAPQAVQRVLAARLAVHAGTWAVALLLGAFCLVPWQGWKAGGRRQLLLALFCLCFVVYSGYPLTHGWGLTGNLWYGVERAARQMMTVCLLLITGELCGVPRRVYRTAAAVGALVALLMLYPQLFLGGVPWGFYLTGAVVRWWHRLAAALLVGFGAWGLWRRSVRSTGLLAAGLVFACATVMDQLYYHEPIVGGWFAEMAGFLILLIVAGILRGEAKETARERLLLREEARLHGQRMELLREKEQVQRLRVEDARAREHETKHRLLALRARLLGGDLPGLEQDIGRWLGEAETHARARYTGNELIDLLSSTAQTQADSMGVELDRTLLGIPPSIAMEDRDLSTILMNLLDNALDACAAMPPGERRWVRLEIRYLQGALSILVENSYSGPRHRRLGRYRSTKEAADGHGYGLRNVDRAVRRYGGTLELRHDGGVFHVHVRVNPGTAEGE